MQQFYKALFIILARLRNYFLRSCSWNWRVSFLLAALALDPCDAQADTTPLVVKDPELLKTLESQGFSFARMAFASSSAVVVASDLKRLAGYKQIVEHLSQDLKQLSKQDPKLATGMRSSHRLFNSQWLSSVFARFELIGVVNRPDRMSFAPASCGEFRFIYRLAYQTPAVYSRLPMTVNVVYWADRSTQQGCKQSAQRWETLYSTLGKQPEQVRPSMLGTLHLKSLEVNLQSVRWPSTVRPDMGGYAEYLMRVFHPKGDQWVLAPLENTPDVALIKAKPALRNELLKWVNDPLIQRQLDQGVVDLPKKFLARTAQSVALNGVHRLANAPFTQLVSEAEIHIQQPNTMRTLRSPHGVLRRLNDLSCMGCHQGRSVAGFHFLGRDRLETSNVNAIQMPSSVHFLLDQPRREAFQKSLLQGKSPEIFRPLSVRAQTGEGQTGSHCGLGDASFASWSCNSGLRCEPVIRDSLVSRTGICMPPQVLAGGACQIGTMRPDVNSHRDSVTNIMARSCQPHQHCEDVSVGFPNGMCSGACSQLQPGETCGSIAILSDFNACLARGRKPFDQCLSENVRPGSLQQCSPQQACRDDYICARNAEQKGVCIPPYFLFQLRVDGHVLPVKFHDF